MATEPLARLIRDNSELDPVRDRLARVARLQRRYGRIAPEALAGASRVCAIDGTTVVVRADNAPVAAALRAMAPRLLAGLLEAARAGNNPLKNKQEEKLTGMRVELQVDAPAPRRAPPPRGELPGEALGKLAQGLADSPLKEALTRIAGDQTKRSTRSKR